MDEARFISCPYCLGKGSIENRLSPGGVLTCFVCGGACVVTHSLHNRYVDITSYESAYDTEPHQMAKSNKPVQFDLFDLEIWNGKQ